MADALGHPEYGYYMADDPFGVSGDFITAPEISQMFGELVGLWCANTWLALGKPTPFVLAELGPGRGTLMADALRALETVPACRAAVQVHLVETSPHLRERQRQALSEIDLTWHDSVGGLPMIPAIFIANEFFDALPIEQYVRHDEGWRQRRVTYGEDGFAFTHAPTPEPEINLPTTAEAGAVIETSPASLEIAGEIAHRVRSHSGAALVIDYGYTGPAVGDTLQAVRNHDTAPVLEQPGTADLTAHVDFNALAAAAHAGGAACWGSIGQGDFLRRLGIDSRAATLIATATTDQKSNIETALERLIGDDQMGTLFKVLAIGSRGTEPPAGFVFKEANLS
ncbi:MAG: class I SAM-dependent methyltransferase [Alphaproteobacteria bacterium]|nr:class I SAM-dependent methyltransferase [Alphaproteobacteria bacterium]